MAGDTHFGVKSCWRVYWIADLSISPLASQCTVHGWPATIRRFAWRNVFCPFTAARLPYFDQCHCNIAVQAIDWEQDGPFLFRQTQAVFKRNWWRLVIANYSPSCAIIALMRRREYATFDVYITTTGICLLAGSMRR